MTQKGTLHATKEDCINKNFDFQSVLFAKYDRAVVAQIFGDKPNDVWFDWKFTSWDGTHYLYFLVTKNQSESSM